MCVATNANSVRSANPGTLSEKATGFMSNADCVLDVLDKRCFGRGCFCTRESGGKHQECLGRVARQASIYRDQMCEAILAGTRAHLKADGKVRDGEVGIHCKMSDCDDEVASVMRFAGGARRGLLHDLMPVEGQPDHVCGENHAKPPRMRVIHADPSRRRSKINEALLSTIRHERYVDNITGLPLDPELCRAARRKELVYLESKHVWVLRNISECLARTGRPPISVRWVETNEGDDSNPNVRSRLVAREMRLAGEEAVFAPTPPLETLRMVLSHAMTDFDGEPKKIDDPSSARRQQVLLVDISRAYFNAPTSDDSPTYVELPPDVNAPPSMCGLLKRHMYGTKRAAEGWQEEYLQALADMGFEQGCASACLFRHVKRGSVLSVHGDDFTASGPKDSLDWWQAEMQSRYELTIGGRLGPGPSDAKEARCLNLIIRWVCNGIEYEADPRLVERLLDQVGLEGANGAATPGAKIAAHEVSSEKELPQSEWTTFRGSAALPNFLSADRPDILFCAKEVCRFMSRPTSLAQAALKKLARYLRARPRMIFELERQTASGIELYSDTDWAGCARTRKSTSGGCAMVGSHPIKAWSSTQASVALSSGEAEYYGLVRGVGIGLGIKALYKDIGLPLSLRAWTDSSAAMGVAKRQGLGKLRHLECQTLWLQHRLRRGEFVLHKVAGESNHSDIFTKHMESQRRLGDLLRLFKCRLMDGRAASAPAVKQRPGIVKLISDGANHECEDEYVAIAHDDHVLPHDLLPEDI